MKQIRLIFIFTIIVLITQINLRAQTANPEEAGMSADRLSRVNDLIDAAIEDGNFPGAVLLVARNGKIVHRRAYGNSQLIPQKRKMETDMIFDMASVTKPVATATSIMLLVERGQIRLWDEVNKYVPEFSVFINPDKTEAANARLWHLLTHTSGLLPYTNAGTVAEKFGNPCSIDSLAKHIAGLRKLAPPGEEFHYSCLGFITMAHIVKQVTGKTVAEFSAENIFKPLGMESTFYVPEKKFLKRCVPTEVINGKPLTGTVHDPLARVIGGVSGNAGLFSTADDLFIFAQMMLNRGTYNGVRILSPLTVDRMTEVYARTDFSGRGLGWDLNSAYSTNGGDLFGKNSYGHSGYTGTSIWIDPDTRTTVIFLTNRVHPYDMGSVVPIRSKIANIVGSAILD